VPKANKNLISVHKLASDNSTFLEYHPNYFVIKDCATRRPLLRGRCHKGLYPLPVKSLKLTLGVFKPSFAWWHSRLGHPSIPIIKRVVNKFNLPSSSEFNKESVCDACQKAKCHQLPYSKSSSSSSHPLELIYSDVWGYAPKSVGGKQYYVSFIDDYSKFSWIYPLKFKSEVFSKFIEFQKLVERLFYRKIITVQTDWGSEYQKLHGFLSKIGITHHVSCPYVHQQNGSAEWKHRHIVEVGLSLLAHASMPLKYWDDAFLAAVYLINRTPSKVHGYETPLEHLFHQKPDYTSLRVFGCAAGQIFVPTTIKSCNYVRNVVYFLDSLLFTMGFKCLDPKSGCVYIYRDVTFDETIFPFFELQPNAGHRL
jgi:hypothetical protein